MVRLDSFWSIVAAGLALGLSTTPAWASPVRREDSSGAISWYVEQYTTHNARQGDLFEAHISNLLNVNYDVNVTYKIKNPKKNDWFSITPEGVISGTPGPSAGETRIRVEAKSSSATSKTALEVTVPVRPAGKPLVEKLSVMTFNLWYGGMKVNDYHAKQVRFLAESGADIVGVQESSGNHATRLGVALGWHYWQGRDVGIISRYPIVKTADDMGYAGFVRVAVDGDKSHVNVWNAHLGHHPYGPYDFCFDKMSVDRVIERELESGRTSEIIDVIGAMKSDLQNSKKIPVLLLGDFNAPSHLDYTEALRKKNCGYANVPWPTSKHPTDAGLVDTFRVAHPDPAAELGTTWSPIELKNSNGKPEPLDRIDFIYQKGNMKVLSSDTIVIGKPVYKPNHENNEWTSDHAVVLTVFRL
jgi:endonuclease/exonuclease/phosphatase family metal-dependent hydrolase